MGQSNPLQTFISCIFRIEKGLLLLGRMLKALRGKRFLSSLFTRLLIGAQHTRKTHSLHNTRTEDIGCERMINPYNSVVLIALFNCSKRHKPLQRSNLVPRTLPTSLFWLWLFRLIHARSVVRPLSSWPHSLRLFCTLRLWPHSLASLSQAPATKAY